MFRYHDPQFQAYFSVGFLEESFPVQQRIRVPYYSVLLGFEATCALQYDIERLTLDAPSVFTLSPGSLIEVRSVPAETYYCIQFNREFYCVEYHDAEVSCNGLLFNAALQPPVITIPESERGPLRLLLQMFEHESANSDRLQLEMLRVLLKRLIISCTRLAKQQLESERLLRYSQTDLLRSYSALVEKHFRELHKVTDYAVMLNRSPKTLSNLFVQYSGRSALQVIHDRLVLEAQRLLLLSDKSAKEISFELGFCDPAQFNRFFKRLTGCTTLEFRETRLRFSA